MVDPSEIVGPPPPLGIPPKGIPPTDRIGYADLVARGKLRPLKWLDVREFGTAGDGQHNDAPALQRALNAAVKQDGAIVYIPEGTYSCGAQVTAVGSPITIVGAGRTQTILTWPSAGGGIKITQSDGGDRTIVRDLTLNTTVAGGGGNALEIVGPASPGNNHVIIQDVHIGGAYWTKGIVLTDLMQSRIEGVRISGLRTTTTHGIHLAGQCTDSLISHCHIDHVGDGVLIDGVTEGFVITDCVFVGVSKGLNVNQSAAAKAWGVFANCHVNSYTYGVLIDSHVESFVHDNLFYKHPSSTSDWYGVRLSSLNDRSRITSNIINYLSSASGVNRGIQITGRWVLIADNICRVSHEAILLSSGSADCIVHDNYRAAGTVTVQNSGTTPARQIHHNGPEVRENRGTATVLEGNTVVTVTHGMSTTPNVGDIQVTPTSQPTLDPGWFRIVNIGDTNFQINVRANPGAGGASFAWSIHTLG